MKGNDVVVPVGVDLLSQTQFSHSRERLGLMANHEVAEDPVLIEPYEPVVTGTSKDVEMLAPVRTRPTRGAWMPFEDDGRLVAGEHAQRTPENSSIHPIRVQLEQVDSIDIQFKQDHI